MKKDSKTPLLYLGHVLSKADWDGKVSNDVMVDTLRVQHCNSVPVLLTFFKLERWQKEQPSSPIKQRLLIISRARCWVPPPEAITCPMTQILFTSRS